MPVTTVTSENPNMRFGATFLNTDYRDRAVNDELLLDKTTGEIVYKSKDNGEFIYYNREQIDIRDLLLNMGLYYNSSKCIIPTSKNCSEFMNTYFMATQYDLSKFALADSSISIINGGMLSPSEPEEFTIAHETNGVFFDLHLRQVDVGYVSMMSDLYDNFFALYTGTDYPDDMNNMQNKDYVGSQMCLNYTISQYKDGSKVKEVTVKGYSRCNQVVYVPSNVPIEYRDNVDYCTFTLNYISFPKVAVVEKLISLSLITKPKTSTLLDRITQVDKLKPLYLNIYSFITTDSSNASAQVTLPNAENSKILAALPCKIFNAVMDEVGNISSGGGVHVSALAPDESTWNKTGLWLENLRNVDAQGVVFDNGAVNNITSLEKYFGQIAQVDCIFTTVLLNNGFYIERTEDVEMIIPDW